MPRGNPKNMVPLNRRTKEEQSEITKKGGKASGVKRRKMKAAREYMKMLISLPLDASQRSFADYMSEAGVRECDQNQLTLMLMSLLKMAQKGDVKSINLVLSLIGQMPATKTEITGADGTALIPERPPLYDLSKLSHDELAALARDAFKEDKGGEQN